MCVGIADLNVSNSRVLRLRFGGEHFSLLENAAGFVARDTPFVDQRNGAAVR